MNTPAQAGAGKSFCAMLKQLELKDDSDARICFIRNTRPQLIAPGALVDESKGIYMQFKPKFRNDILEYTFPSGCKISFKTINSPADLPGYDGTQFTRRLCGFTLWGVKKTLWTQGNPNGAILI